ncbi:MAG: NAD-dependent deacylase, partial [Nocardioides sp.]
VSTITKVVVLTGAGISAESGVPTFRDADGLWEGHRVEDVATPEAFETDPDTVHAFYDARRSALADVEPNPAHHALARLAGAPGIELTLVTQNVDDLHERSGSVDVLHMHGELRSARCVVCHRRHRWDTTLQDRPACPGCSQTALRPDVVWFGEMPHHLDSIYEAVGSADVFAAIGTSGLVYPAAGLVQVANQVGAHTVEFNLRRTSATAMFAESRIGPAGQTVHAWVHEVVAG